MDNPVRQRPRTQPVFRHRSKLFVLWTALLCSPVVMAGNTYIYKDKSGRTHITNVPTTEAGFKLIKTIATPVYKKAPEQKLATTESEPATAGAIQYGGSGWKLIAPSDGRMTAAMLGNIGAGKSTRPFSVNAKNQQRFAGVVRQAAQKYNLDPYLVHAVISAESAYNPTAKSHAGATGLMQLMPATAERFGVKNSLDPVANIHGGARYLRWLLNYFNGNVNLALAGYNAGEGAVVKYNYQIPPYKETQTYVSRVLQFYRHYRSKGG